MDIATDKVLASSSFAPVRIDVKEGLTDPRFRFEPDRRRLDATC